MNNLVFLTCARFFDGLDVFRVQENFLIQFGDPTGTLRGGPGYRIPDEKVVGEYRRGVVAMARDPGSDGAGSQVFIAVDDVELPPAYQIVGHVETGMDVALEISRILPAAGPSGLPIHPREPVGLTRATVTS